MKRGDTWIVAADAGHASKLRLSVIVQDDGFDATRSITMCIFTTDPTEVLLFRNPVAPGNEIRRVPLRHSHQNAAIRTSA